MAKAEMVLEEAQQFLEDAEQAHEGEEDHSEVKRQFKGFITRARSVTFALQDEYDETDGFEEWYEDRVEELGEQGKKFKELRNQVEKEGDVPLGITYHVSFSGGSQNKKKYLAVLDPNDDEESIEIPLTNAFDEAEDYLGELEAIVDECIERFGEPDK